jgi:hypothetical protein
LSVWRLDAATGLTTNRTKISIASGSSGLEYLTKLVVKQIDQVSNI